MPKRKHFLFGKNWVSYVRHSFTFNFSSGLWNKSRHESILRCTFDHTLATDITHCRSSILGFSGFWEVPFFGKIFFRWGCPFPHPHTHFQKRWFVPFWKSNYSIGVIWYNMTQHKLLNVRHLLFHLLKLYVTMQKSSTGVTVKGFTILFINSRNFYRYMSRIV